MIDLKQIDVITFGTTPIKLISFGSTPVWPSDYSYVLYFKSVTYSSTTNKVHATGSDYVTFVCDYAKIRTSTGTLVEVETDVIATPSAQYFIENNGGKLYYDYYNYKATQVMPNDTTSVRLTYRGATTTTTFAFAGNTSSINYETTPVSLTTWLADASGGTLTYTGGTYTQIRHWSSGFDEQLGEAQDIEFGYASNSVATSVYGWVYAEDKEITIDSLGKNTTTAQTYYEFHSTYPSTVNITFTVYQKKNAVTATQTVWKAKNARTGEYFEHNRTIVPAAPSSGDSTFGSLIVQVDYTQYRKWESNAEEYGSPVAIPASVYYDNIIVYDDSGTYMGQQNYDGCIVSHSRGDNSVMFNYIPNTAAYTKESSIIFHGTFQNVENGTSLDVMQEAAE